MNAVSNPPTAYRPGETPAGPATKGTRRGGCKWVAHYLYKGPVVVEHHRCRAAVPDAPPKIEGWHQCGRNSTEVVAGFEFCLQHAKILRARKGAADGADQNER